RRKQIAVSLRRALSDPALLGSSLAGDSWRTWRILLIAAMGEALTDDERETFKRLTGGREREPGRRVEEFTAIVGRRGGKSRAIASLACRSVGLCDSRHVLAPGERGLVLCIAPESKQAHIVLNYCAAIFESSPLMHQLIERRTADVLSLTTGIDIEVRSA